MYIEARDLKARGNLQDDYLRENQVTMAQQPGQQPYVYQTVLNQPYDRTYKRFAGWDIPNFTRRMRNGELLPNTPWTKVDINGSSYGEYNMYNKSGLHQWVSSEHGHLGSTEWLVSETQLLYEAPGGSELASFPASAAAKIYSNGFDALTFVAELGSTTRLFTGLLKKLNKLRIPKGVRRMSSEWLELRYGWRPLLMDITSLNEALHMMQQKRTRYSERVGDSHTTTNVRSSSAQWSYFTMLETVTDEITVSMRGSVTADIDIPLMQVNLLQTGWELIPFSFVIDWLVNVGKFLSALAFACRVKDYTASQGWKVTINRSVVRTMGQTTAIYASGTYGQNGSCVATYESRNPCRITYFPQIALRMNPYKALDLIGLIIQRLV